jgi:hypothetical protein
LLIGASGLFATISPPGSDDCWPQLPTGEGKSPLTQVRLGNG